MGEIGLLSKEVVDYIVDSGKNKVNKSVSILLLQGVFAGVLISIGAIGYFKVSAYTADKGMDFFLGALIFPTGLIAIVLLGAELFTSDTMAMIGAFNRDYKTRKVLKFLGIVLFGNFIGTILMSLLTTSSGIFSEEMLHKIIVVSEKKASIPFIQMLSSSILCNIIVCTGVSMAYCAKDVISKIFAIWFPIAVFVLSSTEHVVANMFCITYQLLH